jgi:hypothetical protein
MSSVTRFKRWSPKGRRLAWARSRAQVERLEERVLLSAEPMVQQTRLEEESPLAATNVQLEVGAPDAGLLTLADLTRGLTRIDLTQNVTQSTKLSAQGSGGRILQLNEVPSNLLIDLGRGDDELTLRQEPDGRLRLGGDSELFELLFPKPSGVLAIRGLDGADKLTLDSVSLDSASLLVDTESILLGAGKSLTTLGNVLLRAEAALESDDTEEASLAAQVRIDGNITAGGSVLLSSRAAASLSREGQVAVALTDLEFNTVASTRVGAQARIDAAAYGEPDHRGRDCGRCTHHDST